jgi:alpha/beta superfamily hydrolase
MARKMESLFLAGPAGRLEALLEEPDETPAGAALVCHPHPRYGGTMHNKVVYRMARGLRRSGHVVLRINYRGVNLSEGSYAHGEGERDDARLALEFLRNRYPGVPLTLAGFSFGSRIALYLGCEANPNGGADIRRVIAVGFPTVYKDQTFLDHCTTPRIFVQSTRDEYGPVRELESLFEALPEPKQLLLVEAQDHFFAGALGELEETIFQLA